jgi:hypothetical protein
MYYKGDKMIVTEHDVSWTNAEMYHQLIFFKASCLQMKKMKLA